MHKIKVAEFEGPLDLLLQLIEENKLEITKVALAEVTEQYIKILNQSAKDQISASDLADFLVIAARLLLIKSRALLPYLQWEEDEGEDLTHQLKIYKEYLEAMKKIQKIIAKKHFAFSREKLLVSGEIGFSPPLSLVKEKLAKIYQEIINALSPILNLPIEIIKRTINLQEKIFQIREKIFRQATTNFSEILKEAKDRTEVIVSFLALLELMKQRVVTVKQSKNFHDIEIEKL
ncbi:MAG TPA: segregation/condensation protein A [Patescibacteria group bacterium]|nr:segregation/condensation protein A [Patescibacteria group bacterium]